MAFAGVVGLIVGFAGFFVMWAADDGSSEWAELGYLVVAVSAGVVGATIAYVAGLVVAAARTFPRGRRLMPVTLALALPLALAGCALSLTLVFPEDVVATVVAVPTAAALLAGPAAFAWSGGRRGSRRLAIAFGAAMAAMILAATAVDAMAQAKTARIASRLPLVLFGETSAEAPFRGWSRDVFRTTWITPATGIAAGGHQAHLKYLSRDGVTFITMYTDVGACSDSPRFTCEEVGELGGRPLREYTNVRRFGSYPYSSQFLVSVYPDGGAVSVNVERATVGPVDARAVLSQLVTVDRAAFEEATNAPMALR